jgi:hypothetical protein
MNVKKVIVSVCGNDIAYKFIEVCFCISWEWSQGKHFKNLGRFNLYELNNPNLVLYILDYVSYILKYV